MVIAVPGQLRPRGSGSSAPPRRAGSVRRTVTMDFTWPDGMRGDTVLDGRARDLRTNNDGATTVLAEASLGLVSDARRIIRRISSTPRLPGRQTLVGESAMSGFRRRLASVAGIGTGAGTEAGTEAGTGAGTGAETGAETPLYQLLDDVPGATLVSGAAWQRWYDMDRYLEIKADVTQRVMTDVCAGYQHGSSALNPDGTLRWQQGRQPAVDIDTVGDDLAWHPHAAQAGVAMRRARRVDVWIAGPVIHVDAFFQDSSTLPEGGRQSIHEYTLTAEADLGTGIVRAVTPVPRVLPYRECPLAVRNVAALAGLPMSELRGAVLQELRGPLGCTHLNDMLRALTAVPALAALLRLPNRPTFSGPRSPARVHLPAFTCPRSPGPRRMPRPARRDQHVKEI